MSLTEQTFVDAITVRDTGHIEVRTVTVILKKDAEKEAVEMARSLHRQVLAPGDDLSKQDARVTAIANAAWTPEVLAAFQAASRELIV